MLNSGFCTQITKFYRSQTSPVVLCVQYSVISTWITCLYGSQPLFEVFASKTAWFAPEWQVSMGPRHDLSFCACTTAYLASELPVSMGARPNLWILIAKQRLLYRIISLYGSQTSHVPLYMQNIVSCTWITSLCRSQNSPAVLCMQDSVISTRITSLYRSQLSSEVFACKTAPSRPELQVSMGTTPHLSFGACKTAWLAPE